MRNISKQELILGFLSTIGLFFKVDYHAIFLSIFCSILWALGGTFKKAIRRFGVPASVAFLYYLNFNVINIFILVSGVLILSIGDGFPDYRKTTFDRGSFLGRLVYKVFPEDKIGGLVTKVIVVVLFQLSLLPIYMRY